MSIQNILNIIGLVVNMSGTLIMYLNTPKIVSPLYLFPDKDLEKMTKQDAQKNKMMRFGMMLLFIGFVIQFIALLF